MSEFTEWMQSAGAELARAAEAWEGGNAGRARVGARRAAGMALKAALAAAPREGYGRSFMHHLNALADDASAELGVREAAARLAAREPPPSWQVEPPRPLTPMADAEIVIAACHAVGAS